MDENSKQGPRPAVPFHTPAAVRATEPPADAGLMKVAPEHLCFAAMFDPLVPGRVNFLIGETMVAEGMQVGAVYHLLGELRSQIRRFAAQKGNKALADAL